MSHLVWLLFGILVPFYGIAQTTSHTWIRNVIGEVIFDGPSTIGKQRAYDNALTEALRQNGILVTSGQLLVESESISSIAESKANNETFVNVVQTATRGFVTAVENERWHPVKNLQPDPAQPPIFQYGVTLDACITIPEDDPDPNFHITTRLDKAAYRDGDLISLEVAVAKECFIQIFDIAADSVAMVYPSSMETQAAIGPKKTLSFPPSGLRWTATLPAGMIESEELLMIVGARTYRSFDAGKVEANGFVGTRHAAALELMSWIASQPRSEIAISWERLHIVRR